MKKETRNTHQVPLGSSKSINQLIDALEDEGSIPKNQTVKRRRESFDGEATSQRDLAQLHVTPIKISSMVQVEDKSDL